MASELTIHNLVKQYGDQLAVNHINMEIEKGEMLSLLGPSGCGKTTTLRMVAGLLEPTSGSIQLGGRELTHVPPYQRKIGMVFQNYALFPHLNIFENVAFGLKRQKVPKEEIRDRVTQALASVQLDGYEKRSPAQLSGGQQQRVALARALVLNPSLILFDEPLSNLDAKLRHSLRVEIRQLQKQHGFTAIFVTHDQEEAMVLSDRIAVMRAGEVVQLDTPEQIYQHPADSFVADFVGESNLLPVQESHADQSSMIVKLVGGQTIHAKPIDTSKQPSLAMIRPESVRLGSPRDLSTNPELNQLTGKISFIHFLGSQYLLGIQISGLNDPFLVRISQQFLQSEALTEGEDITVTWPINSTLVF